MKGAFKMPKVDYCEYADDEAEDFEPMRKRRPKPVYFCLNCGHKFSGGNINGSITCPSCESRNVDSLV